MSVRAAFRRLSAAFGLALLLAGCLPESDNPLSPPDQGAAAPELLGLWAQHTDDGTLYLHVLRGYANQLQIVTVSHDADGSGSSEFYAAHVTPIGDRRFASFRVDDASSTDEETGPYAIVGYAVSGDTLTARFLSPDRLEQAIVAGQLTGTVETDSFGKNVHLTGPGAVIANFLDVADPATLFDLTQVFVRVPPTP